MQPKPARTIWLDYLRAFITVLVVEHHSTLAYTTFASFNPQVYIASTHPVVDGARSFALDILEDFNDVFFMSMMFLISGIFVLPALARKGPRTFLRDRFYRLFIPFISSSAARFFISAISCWGCSSARRARIAASWQRTQSSMLPGGIGSSAPFWPISC